MDALRTALCSLLLLITTAPLSAQGTYKRIDYPGGTDTTPSGINIDGSIVGTYYDILGSHGFTFDGTTFAAIDFPGATSTQASGINDEGQIAGSYKDSAGVYHGFLLDSGAFTTLDFPGAYGTLATGLNNMGQIVGYYLVNANHILGYEYENEGFAAVMPPGHYKYAILTGINNLNDITGYTETFMPPLPYRGFRLSNEGIYAFILFPKSYWTLTLAVNDSRTITGYYADVPDGPVSGFVLMHGNFIPMNVPASLQTACLGINAANQIVGTYTDATGTVHGFLWTPSANAPKP